MKFMCPMLVVSDIETTKNFYKTVLNESVIIDYGANITFSSGFAAQSKSSWAKFLGVDENGIKSGLNNFELYFESDDLDAFVKKLTDLKVKFAHDVITYDWGQRVIRFYDPDMHLIEVGENFEITIARFLKQGLSVEETAKITMQPVEFVGKIKDGLK